MGPLYQLNDPEMRQLLAEAAAIGAQQALAKSRQFEKDLPADEIMKCLNIKAPLTFRRTRQALKIKPTRRVGRTDMYLLSDFQKSTK